ncbi:MAG: glycerophosphodiester phosphodiesterase family protein [bacterium]|nr:glycerophosphodiester phosphodiesterase family protein [bacterium]
MNRSLAQAPYPWLCAHRGLSHACPENTLPAFGAAIAVGVHEIEFDLWMSEDGVAVVCHDPKVDRTTSGTGRVTEMAWEEICQLDAGVGYGDVWQGVRVPRLEEILDLVDGRVGMNIHIKDGGPDGELVKLVCDLLREREPVDGTYLALGQDLELALARSYAPEITRACLRGQHDPDEQIEKALAYDCKRIQFGRTVREDQIRKAQEAGLICNVFWADELDDALKFVDQGVDVILTNAAHVLIAGGFSTV